MHTFQRLIERTKFKKLLVLLFTLSIFLGTLMVPIEKNAPGATITNYFDSTWWTVTTITTVGYGDMVPVTRPGKMLAMILQLSGVVMFGSIIATISIALNRRQEEYYQHFYLQRVLDRLDNMEAKIDSLAKDSRFLVKKDL